MRTTRKLTADMVEIYRWYILHLDWWGKKAAGLHPIRPKLQHGEEDEIGHKIHVRSINRRSEFSGCLYQAQPRSHKYYRLLKTNRLPSVPEF
jgi:hypothetical protein